VITLIVVIALSRRQLAFPGMTLLRMN